MDNLNFFFAFSISFVANFLSALAGGGSGLFLLPALLFLGIPYPVALASHKIATVGLGVGATIRHSFVKDLDKRFMLWLCCIGIPGVILGAFLAIYLPEDIAKLGLGLLILSITAINIKGIKAADLQNNRQKEQRSLITGYLGVFVIAVLNGSLTSGTGLLFTMWLVYWFRCSFMLALSYTMIVCGFIYNSTGALVLGTNVSLNVPFVSVLVLGAVLGGFLGASLSLHKGEEFIKKVFTISCAIIGSALIYQSILDFI